MRFPEDVPTLTDGTVTLRAHREDDAQGCLEQCQDPLSQRWTTVPIPYAHDDALRFVTGTMPSGWESGKEWGFAVEAVDQDGRTRYAGTVSLRDLGERRAEVAYGSHPWARGKAVMTRAMHLLLGWGFDRNRLETVVWWCHTGNWASRRLAWRLGFSVDGTVRHWLPQRGELLDAWVGVLLHGDERAPRVPWLHVPTLVGPRVLLRAHRRSDAARVREACDDTRTAYWLNALPSPYTMGDAERFIESRTESAARGAGVHWAVADPTSDQLLGTVSVFDIEHGNDAEVGYWAHPDARARGVITEACALAVRHAFVDAEDGGLGLRRLKVFAAEGNRASQRVIGANGFVETGRHRADSPLRDGTWVDTLAYDLLRSEYDV